MSFAANLYIVQASLESYFGVEFGRSFLGLLFCGCWCPVAGFLADFGFFLFAAFVVLHNLQFSVNWMRS